MKYLISILVLACLLGGGIANAQESCGDNVVCITNQFLKGLGFNSPGIQKDSTWASCYPVDSSNQSLARTTGEKHVRYGSLSDPGFQALDHVLLVYDLAEVPGSVLLGPQLEFHHKNGFGTF